MATIVAQRSGLYYQKRPGGLPSVVDTRVVTGNVFYVDANAAQVSTTDGTHPDTAFSTIDGAINACTASQGDTIYVLPGHTETLADATSLVPDTVGVSIIGLGRGSDRPTLTLSATGSNIPISGANCVLENFLITTTGVINCTAGITVTGTDVLIKDVEMRESGATSQIVDGIVAAATSDRLHVNGYVFRGHLTGDADASGISVTGAVDGVLIENFDIDGLFSAAGIENVTGAMTNLMIRDGFIRQRHATVDAAITIATGNTGSARRVDIRTATDDDAGITAALVGDAFQWYNIGIVNAVDEHAAYGEMEDLDAANTRSGKTFSNIA